MSDDETDKATEPDDTGVQSDETTELVGEPHAVPGDTPEDVTEGDEGESDEAGETQADEQAEDEQDEDQPDEHGTPQATARAMSERDIERVNRQLEGEAHRHAKRVLDIMGDDAEVLVVCPLCLPLIPGFRYPQPPVAEQLAAVKAAIGEPVDPPLSPDTYSNVCSKCDGWGAVSTGSKVVGRNKVTCLDCEGLGYVATDTRRQGGALTAGNGVTPVHQYDQPMPAVSDPPEVAKLKELGYVVVPPIDMSALS